MRPFRSLGAVVDVSKRVVAIRIVLTEVIEQRHALLEVSLLLLKCSRVSRLILQSLGLDRGFDHVVLLPQSLAFREVVHDESRVVANVLQREGLNLKTEIEFFFFF